MDDIKKIITDNYEQYPKLQVQDVFKMLYQNEFGCGHLVSDPKISLDRLESEWNTAESNEGVELFEYIGNGFSRLNVSAAKAMDMPIELFHKLFLNSAELQTGTVEGFLKKAEIVKELCSSGELPFSIKEIDDFIAKWENEGHPLFSHSKPYKKAYNPAYRVVFSVYSKLMPLLIRINEMQNKGAVIAIDGRCGSGKTTLSNMLSQLFDTTVIHMDDFFLPKELRTAERLNEPGGNIHYERFCDEVVDKIKHKDFLNYKIFDCSIMDYKDTVHAKRTPIMIIEGAYSIHPLFESVYDLKVFCDIDKDTQKDRIVNRNGTEGYINFRDRWIPMEEKYFSKLGIREKCDYIVSI